MPKLTFEESYFEGEMREDFYIEPMMKRAWAAQLEVVCELQEIFEKHHIQWFADWGTMLGAVRHQGFIPWDDDIDLAMMRSDYLKLCEIAEELPEGYRFYRVGENAGMNLPFARITNTGGKIDFTEPHLQKYHGCPYSVGVDIFIIDVLPNDNQERELLSEITEMLIGAIHVCVRNEDVSELLPQIEALLGVTMDPTKDLRGQLFTLLDQISQMYLEDGGEAVSEIYYWQERKELTWRREWFEKSISLPFENISIPVPAEYDAILKSMYGEYRIPMRGGGDHDYPFYKKQEKAVMEYLHAKEK